MALNIKPIANRVVLEPIPAETKTASGIIIPITVKERYQKGTVVAVGNGKKEIPLTVKEGDTVLYDSDYEIKIKVEGKDYLLLDEENILAIM
ncbi:co-chaperone GroES [Flavobacterium sp. LaA7.5]|nr:co-chaperone GroES [Flavobacterium salilacus subsp. altitudinum]